MEQTLNYGIILFGDTRICGWVTDWEYPNNGSVTVVIEGVKYKTGVNNLLLKHKEPEMNK